MATTLFLLQEGGDRGHFDCLLRQGKFCHKGTVDAGSWPAALRDVVDTVAHQVDDVPFYALVEDLPTGSISEEILVALEAACEFFVDELLTLEGELSQSRRSSGFRDWASIDWDGEDAFFEFVASGNASVLRRTNVEALLALPLVVSRQKSERRRGNSRGNAIALNIVICGGRFFVSVGSDADSDDDESPSRGSGSGAALRSARLPSELPGDALLASRRGDRDTSPSRLRSYRTEASGFSELVIHGARNFSWMRAHAGSRPTAAAVTGPTLEVAQKHAAPSEGYNQTYIVRSSADGVPSSLRQVFFRCGNYCYSGQVDLGVRGTIGLAVLPRTVARLQSQQGHLSYVGEWNRVSSNVGFTAASASLSRAAQFMQQQMMSDATIESMIRHGGGGSLDDMDDAEENWINDESESFFEVKCRYALDGLKNIDFVASKMYMRGVVLVTVLHGSSVYSSIADAETADCPLLDTRFPDFEQRGRALKLRVFAASRTDPWEGLTLWQRGLKSTSVSSVSARTSGAAKEASKKAHDEDDAFIAQRHDEEDNARHSDGRYRQTYVILEPGETGGLSGLGGAAAAAAAASAGAPNAATQREVLFEFGTWCYAGKIELGVNALQKKDLPHIVPVLQLQQSNLKYCCRGSQVPARSRFFPALRASRIAASFLEQELCDDDTLRTLGNLADSPVYSWINDTASGETSMHGCQPYFELAMRQSAGTTAEDFEGIEFVASKHYMRSIILYLLWYNGSFYATIADAELQQHPLLDTRFPDVSGENNKGILLHTYGLDEVEDYTKLMLWQGKPKRAAPGASTAKPAKASSKTAEPSRARASGGGSSDDVQGGDAREDRRAVASAMSEVTRASKPAAKVDDTAAKVEERPAARAELTASSRQAASKRDGDRALDDLIDDFEDMAPVARASHHLAPLRSTGRLPALNASLSSSSRSLEPAWDAMGRPKTLGFKK